MTYRAKSLKIQTWRRRIGAAVVLAAAAAFAATAPAGAQGTITADEFQGTTLNPVWTLSNPVGDASVTVGGGHANVVLPSGATHDVWGNNYSVSGLRQAAPNRDFEIEAKFDTAATTGYQQQGIIVEQDSNDLVRAEVHNDGGGSRLFVATIAEGSSEVRTYQTVAGGAPLYLRVVRTGSTWRVRYSNDGSSWISTDPFNFNLTVAKVGPLVGNSGNPAPAFTSQIDWFKEILPDSTAPVITAIGATPRTIGANVQWTTDESATSEVLYGKTTAYGSAKVASTGLVTAHDVALHGLACGTTYHYQVRSKDSANNTATGPDRTSPPRPARRWRSRTTSTERRST